MKTIRIIKQKIYLLFVIVIFVIFFVLPLCLPYTSLFILLSINFLYLFTDLIKLFLFCIGIYKNNISKYYNKDNLTINDDELPIYSILLPVRKEKYFVLNNLLKSIYNLEYPKNKMDVKIIVDEDDVETIKNIKDLSKIFNFDLIVVPNYKIKSKPLSCNYALKSVKGEFLTVYDAEDKPEKYQLRKAIQRFRELDKNTICLQASLNYYNKYDNFLSYCFSIEYSMWFDFTINSINQFTYFFPLGGTSNHFKTAQLIEIGGWDGYNMTEDAEIGIRIIKAGYKISTLNSITEEECPIEIKSWLKQRTRWFKGFMQTFCEHTLLKRPINSVKVENKNKFCRMSKLNLINIIIFHIFISMSFFFFISLLIICYNDLIFITIGNNSLLDLLIIINAILLIFILYMSFIIICIKSKIKFNFLYFLCFPFYWFLHYIAGIRALYYLIATPFYWSKTEHGTFKNNKIQNKF